MCYCRSCQAFAYFLGCEKDVLDEQGGSDIVQVRPSAVHFEQGAEHVGCLRLTREGTLRWYAQCCRTPIGNTVANPKVSFVGLIHPFVTGTPQARDSAFGPVTARIFTDAAAGEPRPRPAGFATTMVKLAMIILGARINGDYRRTPFFRSDMTSPIAPPHVLTTAEFTEVMERVCRRR